MSLVSAVMAISVGVVERRRRRHDPDADVWPTFWFAVAAIVTAVLVAQAVDAGDVVADLGRRQARSSGWYQARSVLQVVAVGAVLSVSLVITAVGARRRRGRLGPYLPTAALTLALIAYGAIRSISLHTVDTFMNREGPAGTSVESAIEFVLVSALAAAVIVRWRTLSSERPDHEPTLRSPAPRSR